MSSTHTRALAKLQTDPERYTLEGRAPDSGKHVWYGEALAIFEQMEEDDRARVVQLAAELERFNEDEIVTSEDALMRAVRMVRDGGGCL